MAAVRIVLLGTAAAVLYGIVHDQVTIRICPEYFTIGHPHLLTTGSLTLLALAWGVVATWWVGLPLGILLAVAARAGGRPKMGAGELIKPVGILLASMLVCAVAVGLIGFLLARGGKVWLLPPLADRIPRERHVAFLADLWAHRASYASGVIGGLVLCFWTWRWRGRARSPR